MRSNHVRAKERGFSFIEILIVMGIIAVLVGGVTVAIMMVGRSQPKMLTKNTIGILSTLTRQWENTFGMLPPTNVKELPKVTGYDAKIKGAANTTNLGAEALYLAHRWPGFKLTHEFNPSEIGNTDEDKLDAPVATDGIPELREILDAWGNPIIYFHHLDYGKYADNGQMYVTGPEGEVPDEELEAMPWRNADGQFINANGFQLFSMGPDGEPNTEDDIGNWEWE